MHESSSAPVREGEVLARKYRVEKVLGVGGMGVVVAAMHLQLDQRVALKFLLPAALRNPEVVERFAREARAAARIRSEHVARVIDVGELESGSPFIVMEFLEGEDLAELLERRGPLPPAEAVGYVLEACDALAEAHAVGIVHRDLKPSNLFVAKRADGTPIVKVLDFGISKMTTAIDGQLTSTQALLGSPLYMSPDQLTAAKTVDARSDIWAMGVILYELFTGRPPFLAETMPELVAAILTTTPSPVDQGRPEIPPVLAAAVMRCLAKDRRARFANVAALANELFPFAATDGRRLRDRISRVLGEADAPESPRFNSTERILPATAAPLSSAGATSAKSAWGATQAPAPRSPEVGLSTRVLVAAGLALVATIAVVVGLKSLGGAPPPATGLAAVTTAASVASVPSSRPVPAAATPVASVVDPVPSTLDAPMPTPAASARVLPRTPAAPRALPQASPLPSMVASVTPTLPAPAPPPSEPVNKMKMEMK